MSWDPVGLSQNRAVIPTGSGGFIAIIALCLTDSLTSQNSAQELLERLFSSLGTQCRGFTEPFHVQHKDWAHVGAAPAHPQHHHEMLGPTWSQINQGGTKPMPVPQSCQPTCACTASKHQAGQEIQENGMVAAGMSVGQCCSLAHCAGRMPLLAGWQSQAVEDGSKMGRFTLDPTSWDTTGTSGDGQVLAATAGAQPAWPKL